VKQKSQSCTMKKTSIGGQALIEGIMMRGPENTAMAVRNTKGEIVLEITPTAKPPKYRLLRAPFFRGMVNFILSMKEGYRCLMRSAEISGLEELEEEERRRKAEKKQARAQKKKKPQEPAAAEADTPAEEPTAEGQKEEKKESGVMTTMVMIVSVVLGVALAIGLFTLLPVYTFRGLAYLFPALEPRNEIWASLIKSVVEGLIRIAILVAYMGLMTLMKDIRRTFQYHGAEHKTIFCYEHGKELTVENVRGEGRFHPRCGTSFLILMLLVSIFVTFFIDPLFLLTLGYVPSSMIRVLVKLLLLPLIMGIGYELIRLAGRHNNAFTRIISAPGVWLQHITVLEPTDDMIECALAAFIEAMPEDERPARQSEES